MNSAFSLNAFLLDHETRFYLFEKICFFFYKKKYLELPLLFVLFFCKGKTMVLKTRPVQPVRSPIGHGSSLVQPIGPGSHRTEIEPFESTIRLANRLVPSDPNNSFSFSFPHATGTPTVTWSIIRTTTVPPLLLGASSAGSTPSAGNPASPPPL